jgi:hypothetical protein
MKLKRKSRRDTCRLSILFWHDSAKEDMASMMENSWVSSSCRKAGHRTVGHRFLDSKMDNGNDVVEVQAEPDEPCGDLTWREKH